jgi:hypothetical protein
MAYSRHSGDLLLVAVLALAGCTAEGLPATSELADLAVPEGAGDLASPPPGDLPGGPRDLGSPADCAGALPGCIPCSPTPVDACPPGRFCAVLPDGNLCLPGCKSDQECKDPARRCNHGLGTCVMCLDDNDCGPGNICADSKCVNGCDGQRPCDAGKACCGRQCRNLDTDYLNCGACGNGCNPGWTCCKGACRDLSSDDANCSGCGNACVPDCYKNPTHCVKSQCLGPYGFCMCGWADCVGNRMCETHVDVNPNNCGKCNNVCFFPNALPKCVGGMCQIGSCLPGFGDCDKQPGNGCEINLLVDAANCGACGAPCAMGLGCVMGKCQ